MKALWHLQSCLFWDVKDVKILCVETTTFMNGMRQRFKAGYKWWGRLYRKERGYWITGNEEQVNPPGLASVAEAAEKDWQPLFSLTCRSLFSLKEQCASTFISGERTNSKLHKGESSCTVTSFYTKRNTWYTDVQRKHLVLINRLMSYFFLFHSCVSLRYFPWSSLVFTKPYCNRNGLRITFSPFFIEA